MNQQLKQKFCGGFTLLEILVVIIISLVVIAFSVPAYKNMQYKNNYLAAQAALLDIGNGVRMFKADYPDYTPEFTNVYCGVSSNPTNSNVEPPTNTCTRLLGWLMTNKYISNVPIGQGNVASRYMGYLFRYDVNGLGDIGCCAAANTANAIACMVRSSTTSGGAANKTPSCAWITPTGEFHHNLE